jgi:hypothetical protein
MKKLFALLLLPSIAFAGKIGENYVTSGSSTPWTTDTELSIFTAILRPHYDLGVLKSS